MAHDQVMTMLVMALISMNETTGAYGKEENNFTYLKFTDAEFENDRVSLGCTDKPASNITVFQCKIHDNDEHECHLGIQCNPKIIKNNINFQDVFNILATSTLLQREYKKVVAEDQKRIEATIKLNGGNSICVKLILPEKECEDFTHCHTFISIPDEICAVAAITPRSKIDTANTTFTRPSSAISSSLETGTTISSLTSSVNAYTNATRHAQVNSNISVELAAGLSVLSVFTCLGVFALVALMWKRCHDSKLASSHSTMGNTSMVEINEIGMIKSEPHPRPNNYDQIVIDDFQNHSYTPISLISNETSPIGSHTTNQHEETITCHNKSGANIHQIYSQLGEVTCNKNTDYNQVLNNNMSVQNGNSDKSKKGECTADYGDEAEKTNNDSVYFELEKSDEHKEDDFSTHNDTLIFRNSPKRVSVFSNLRQENTGDESNLEIPIDISALNPPCQQVCCDPSTYFELEKQEEGIDDNTTDTNSMTTVDQYSKLREVSRDIGNDYNELSTLGKTSENENALSSYNVLPETIPSWSNYSLAQIPITTSDNDTTTVILSTGEDTLMTVN